jgi:hypothetical protein
MMHALYHTQYVEKQIVELVIASLTVNTMFGANYKSHKHQNGPIFHERATQNFHVSWGEAPLTFVHLSILTKGYHLPT